MRDNISPGVDVHIPLVPDLAPADSSLRSGYAYYGRVHSGIQVWLLLLGLMLEHYHVLH